MAWALSADTQLDEANTAADVVDGVDAGPGEQPLETSASNGPEAPLVEPEPTSSWSNSAATPRWGPGSAPTRAVIAAQHDTWLSRRPLAMQRPIGAEHGRRLDVVEAELPERRRDAGALAEPGGEVGAARRRPGGPHRPQVDVPVEDEAAVVDLAVEVDRQLRDAGDGLVGRRPASTCRRRRRPGRRCRGRGRASCSAARRRTPRRRAASNWRRAGRHGGGCADPASRCAPRRCGPRSGVPSDRRQATRAAAAPGEPGIGQRRPTTAVSATSTNPAGAAAGRRLPRRHATAMARNRGSRATPARAHSIE